ncbi:MAG: UDP-N-acetylmuramoyl-L-alanine--D-glutamate ligase, partial [Sphingobium sp.]|nr:UDP-N-acetylmuramoyl-L-alanine--D-glutamate ligase [Sphingobium sp.]
MITTPAWRGKRYAVLGLARSGAAAVAALLAGGAEVTVWDTDPARREAMSGSGAALGDPETFDLVGFDGLIVSPGVPINRHPVAAKARTAGVPIIGDIELFAQARAALPPHTVVGITGTNGKSTTTALVHHILQTAGIPSLMGGNIGLPILAQPPLAEGGVYVLELSS